MKRLTLIILAMMVLLTGCGVTTGNNGSQPGETDAAEAGYVFKANGVTMTMHAEAAPILEQLGEPQSTFEAESCAFQGMERQYTYPGFTIFTYELASVDHVASILIMDDTIGTQEGIYLNSSLEEVIAAYGKNYTQSLGLYSFESGAMKLNFIIEENKVTSIEYFALSGDLAPAD